MAANEATSATDHPENPLLDRVMANQFTLILGFIASALFAIVGLFLVGIIHATQGRNPLVGVLVLAVSSIVIGATLRQLLWPVPLVEVIPQGVRLRIGAPMSRRGLYLVPWSHLRAVVTQVATARGGREEALGFQIIQDETIRLPDIRWSSGHAALNAPKCEVVFAASNLNGDPADWARRIEAHRPEAGAAKPT